MPNNDKLQHPVHNIPNIYANKIRAKKSFPLENITTTKEEYHNILNELLELQSMPDIGNQMWYWPMGSNGNLTLSSWENYIIP